MESQEYAQRPHTFTIKTITNLTNEGRENNWERLLETHVNIELRNSKLQELKRVWNLKQDELEMSEDESSVSEQSENEAPYIDSDEEVSVFEL